MSVAVQPVEFPSLVKVTRELLANNETFVKTIMQLNRRCNKNDKSVSLLNNTGTLEK